MLAEALILCERRYISPSARSASRRLATDICIVRPWLQRRIVATDRDWDGDRDKPLLYLTLGSAVAAGFRDATNHEALNHVLVSFGPCVQLRSEIDWRLRCVGSEGCALLIVHLGPIVAVFGRGRERLGTTLNNCTVVVVCSYALCSVNLPLANASPSHLGYRNCVPR